MGDTVPEQCPQCGRTNYVRRTWAAYQCDACTARHPMNGQILATETTEGMDMAKNRVAGHLPKDFTEFDKAIEDGRIQAFYLVCRETKDYIDHTAVHLATLNFDKAEFTAENIEELAKLAAQMKTILTKIAGCGGTH